MATDIISTDYETPANYLTSHADAKEAGDIRFLHASASVIRINGVPIVAIENLNISQTISRQPIYSVGSIVPIGFDVNGVQVSVSGQLVQLASMSLNDSLFYPNSEADIISNINKVFQIDVMMIDYTKDDPLDYETDAFLSVLNCQNTGSNITINPNAMLKDSFSAVGTFMARNPLALTDFNATITA